MVSAWLRLPLASRTASWCMIKILICVGLLSSIACAQQRYDFTAPLMATTFHISLHASSEQEAARAADAAFKHIARLNSLFSDYEPKSELMRLCDAGQDVPFKASADLFHLMARAVEISRLTSGAFDITCGNLTRLWRHTRRVKKLPPSDRLAKALTATDWHAVRLDPRTQTITLTQPGMLLDLGGIAKGYAADEGLRILREHGITRALVMAGGDISLGDAPPEADAWEIKLRALTHPNDGSAESLKTVRLKRCGVSTSGDLYQFTEIGGVRYSHIVSPKTGLGLTQRIACSVIAPDATTSDALATAMCVMGRAEGEKTAANLQGVTVHFAP